MADGRLNAFKCVAECTFNPKAHKPVAVVARVSECHTAAAQGGGGLRLYWLPAARKAWEIQAGQGFARHA